eukprot:TRINITY_DN3039_c0_g2_i1.p1 TRINITY_DN3039_c0_g2~~TRINITY_DN3039_c0_g2_i1.p1  ORF type:complete len:630 (+),score=79.91 TRINITY_DN3039_c0_g2_i1:128-1891(+)
MSAIGEVVAENSFAYLSLGSKYAPHCLGNLANEIDSLLKINPTILSHFLIRNCGHRSKTISTLFTFLTIQSFNVVVAFPVLQEVFQQPKLEIFKEIKALAQRKMTHVRIAVQRIFLYLDLPTWENLVIQAYDKDNDILQDIAQPSHLASLRNSQRPLLPEFLLNFIVKRLRRCKNESDIQKLSFLLRDGVFFTLLDAIVQCDPVHISRTQDTYAILMAEIIHVYSCTSWLSFVQSVPEENRTTSMWLRITLSLDDIRRIADYIEKINPKKNKPLSYSIKTSLLRCLQYALRGNCMYPLIFEFPDLFSRHLLHFCRDGLDFEFNRQAWKTFYQVIHLHAGVLDFLMEKNLLKNYLENVSVVVGNTVVANSLHYLAKLLSMVQCEQRKLSNGVTPSRGELDSIIKDVRNLNKYICNRRLFIKIHMLEKRFTDNDQFTKYPGLAWVRLVEFYQALDDMKANNKLRKDIRSNAEYAKGYELVMNMIGKDLASAEYGLRRAASQKEIRARSGARIGDVANKSMPKLRSSNAGITNKRTSVHAKRTESPKNEIVTSPAPKRSGLMRGLRKGASKRSKKFLSKKKSPRKDADGH